MKTHRLFAILALCSLSSCEKARRVVTEINEKTAELAKASELKKTDEVASFTGELVTDLSPANYTSFIEQSGKVIIVDYYADWCGPCKKLAPILDRVATSHGGSVLVGKINIDKNPDLAAKEGVSSIPDVRIFFDGKEVDRFVGMPGEDEVKQRIEAQTKKLKVIEPVAPETEAATDEAPAPPIPPKTPQPTIAPGSKDWLPPGMQRR